MSFRLRNRSYVSFDDNDLEHKKVLNVFTLSKQIRKHINKGETTLLLTIYNSLNQRRYLGVKID